MSAPTLWEEGRWSGTRVTRLCVVLCLLLTAAGVLIQGRLGLFFDIGFVLICLGAALAIHPEDFFRVGVLPPLLLLGISVVTSALDRGAVAAPSDSYLQAVISGLAHHAGALAIGYGLALAVLAVRHRVLGRHRRGPHSKREGSPAPYRAISGAPEEKSTTVVGSEPQTPQSMTASS